MTASLYIHIPFCASKCSYCDFFSVPLSAEDDAALQDSFVGAILDDIKDQLELFGVTQVPSVYIGGGSPSVLGAARIERLLAGLGALLPAPCAKNIEVTIEANPESSGEDFLRACAGGCVTRISIGAQTFYEPSRRAVNRAGSAGLLKERLALCAQYFPGAFSADLITGLPFQTEAVTLDDIASLLRFKPAHVSLYSLIVEPQTPLGRRIAEHGGAELPLADDADNAWIAGRDALEAAGLAQYEVSNFAAGKTCAHNIRYWRMENWLGAGPGASGTIIDDAKGTGRRYTYPADIAAYLAAPRPRLTLARAEELNAGDLMRETLLMGFRYREGPDPELFRRRFGRSIKDCIPQTIERWRGRGFFEAGDDLRPSRAGLLQLNGFLRNAFEEIRSEK